jgi:serine/threonine protein kinase
LTFSANDKRTGERVALKFLRPEYARDYRGACFEREIEIATQLVGRDSIVQLRGGPDTFNIPLSLPTGGSVDFPLRFFALEHASGTLTDFLFGLPSPGLRRRLEVVRDVTKGVNRLHSLGYCHRDLKPDNILMFGGGIAKLGDLGTCRLMDRDDPALSTYYSAPPGDLRYCAPELLCGGWSRRDLFAAADWFGVGAILFEAVAGINLYVNIGLASNLLSVIDGFRALPSPIRLQTYLRQVESAADRNPIPSILDFVSTSACLAQSTPETLERLDGLLKWLCHFDYRRRLADFNRVLRRIDIVLGHVRQDELRRARRALKGSGGVGRLSPPVPTSK